jgi:asparagine synthase (glutamine-hydrolysing)
MCGIVGLVNLNPAEPVDELVVKRMRDTLRHRGPDGEGLWVEGGIGLGHRRLAIVDPAGGHQPMTNEDQSCWIVLNGEIYNHAALRPGLEARGHRYSTRSDTETILHAYEEERERCVERLQGMFAFALWDRRRGQLLLARDRLGIKPLYYAVTDTQLIFASEIKAILATGGLEPKFNTSILPEFLATRFTAGEETFLVGVRKLLPGRTLVWSFDGGLRQRRYWRVPLETEELPAGFKECAAEIRAQLEAAVRSHLMSDVPLGLFLSGGVDSTALAGLMAPMLREPVRTFSVGFEEREANELAYARLAARAIGAEHREVVMSPEAFFGALPRLVWHEDEPIAFTSSVPLYFVSRLAREHVKVVLTGEGADELFLGYNRYRVTAWNERMGRAYRAVMPRPIRDAVMRVASALPGRVRRYTERTFLTLRPGPRSLFYENFSVFSTARQEDLLADNGWLAAHDPYAEGLRYYAEGAGDPLERMSRADLQTYLVELLMKQDQMSMAASVESRVPFLDHAFVEHAMAIPARFKLRGWETKAVLREAVRDVVPRPILERRKMGFPVPVGRWLRGPLWEDLEQFVVSAEALERGLFDPVGVRRLVAEHQTGHKDHGDRLWLLINLELWHRVVLEAQDPDTLMPRLSQCAYSG